MYIITRVVIKPIFNGLDHVVFCYKIVGMRIKCTVKVVIQ